MPSSLFHHPHHLHHCSSVSSSLYCRGMEMVPGIINIRHYLSEVSCLTLWNRIFKALGVDAVFPVGTPLESISQFIRENVK